MRERKRYLDYAKGFGILCIVLAHCIQYFKPMIPLNKFVCSFHVPVFFVVSGFLAWINRNKDISFNLFVKRRACFLLIPYVIYSLFNSTLKLSVLALKNAISAEAIKDEMVALFITGNGTVWFLVTLFIVEVLFFLVKPYIGKWALYISVVFLILPYMLYPFLQFSVGVVIIRVVAAIGFYLFGYKLCELIESVSKHVHRCIYLFVVISGTVSYFILGSNFSFFDGKFQGPVYSLISGVLLSVAAVCGCKCLEEESSLNNSLISNVLEFFGKNSIIVMLIHPTILLLFTYPFAAKFWGMDGFISVITAIFLFLIISVVQVPVVYVVNRWFGWTLGRIKKVEKNG